MTKQRPVAALLPVLLLGGCALFGEHVGDASEVAQHQRQWERLRIDAYEYDLTVLCFCPPVGVVRVQVRADTVHTATVLETGAPVDASFLVKTINDLFEIVEDAAKQEAHRLDVAYDSTFGYPTYVSIDYDVRLADEEVTYVAENLRPLRED